MATMARWLDMAWEVSSGAIRAIENLSTAYRLKSVEDAEQGTNKVKGFELQPLTCSYSVSVGAGVDPRAEYEKWLGRVGKVGPFYLGSRRFGPPRMGLCQVALGDVVLGGTGKMLSATISLTFEEDADEGGKAVERMQILYGGADIYDAISVNACVHDMYAASRSDELLLRFNDTNRMWDSWGPENEQTIEVAEGAARTGKMFIESVVPENGMMTLRAYSVPPSAMDSHTESWEQVMLLQLAEKVAGRHGLGVRTYDVTDQLYEYVRQENLPDFTFLEQRCALEGVGFLVYDGDLVLYGESAMESAAPAKSIEVTTDGDFTYSDDETEAYGTSELTNGTYSGSFAAPGGCAKVLSTVLSIHLSGEAEACRFAKGLLRYENRQAVTGSLQSPLLRDLAAGSVVTLQTAGAGSWDGPAFIHRLRHDYVAERSKLFFRKRLEGY